MPSSACEPMLGSLEDKLRTLKLANPGDSARLDRVMAILGDLIGSCPAPSSMIESGVDECTLWEIFASVFETEVATQQGRRKKLCLQDRRQILADILVWAEVTQAHYDPGVYSFVMSPHNGDQSFQRIGTMLAKARAAAGLTTRNVNVQDSGTSTMSGTSPLSVSVSSADLSS